MGASNSPKDLIILEIDMIKKFESILGKTTLGELEMDVNMLGATVTITHGAQSAMAIKKLKLMLSPEQTKELYMMLGEAIKSEIDI